MICKKCGADIGNKGKCEYCNTVYFEEIQRPKTRLGKKIWTKLKNRQKGIFGKIWTKLTLATKIVSAILLLLFIFNFPQDQTTTSFSQYIWSVIFSLLLFGGITQLISSKYIKRHKAIQAKKVETRTKLTLATKIVSAIWLSYSILEFPQAQTTISFFQYIWTVIFGLLFFGGITQLISSKRKRRHMPNHSEQPIRPLTRNAGLSPKPYDNMDIPEFESFCCDILEQNGFTGISITKTPEDQGIDIIAFKNGAKYGIQCKCGASNIETTTVQKTLAGKSYFGCDYVVIMTNQKFDEDAKMQAEKEEISIWDRVRLDKFISDI